MGGWLARLLSLWPRFDSRLKGHVVRAELCYKGFSPGSPVFLPRGSQTLSISGCAPWSLCGLMWLAVTRQTCMAAARPRCSRVLRVSASQLRVRTIRLLHYYLQLLCSNTQMNKILGSTCPTRFSMLMCSHWFRQAYQLRS